MNRQKDVDGGWAWLVAFGVFLSFLLLGGFSRSFGILYSEFLEMFDESAASTSLIPAVRTACPILIGPLSTVLSERYTERRVVIAGSLFITAGFVLSFFAISLNFLIFSLGLIPGIGMALLISPSNVSMGKYFQKRRSRVYSLTSCGVCIGLMCVPMLLTYLIEVFSVRGTLLIFGGICLNLVITGQVQKPLTEMTGDDNTGTEPEINLDNSDVVNSPENHEKSTERGENSLSEESESKTLSNFDPLRIEKQQSGQLLEENKDSSNDSVGFQKTDMSKFPVEMTNYDDLADETEQPILEQGTAKSGEITPSDNIGEDLKLDKRTTFEDLKHTLYTLFRDLFDMTLMKNPVFLIFLCSGTLSDITYANQSIYLVPLVESRGISLDKAAVLLSIMGGCDVIGRIASGVLADTKPILPHHVMCVCGLITGIVCCFFVLCFSFNQFIPACIAFALVSSAPTLLIMPAIANSVGVTSLARGLGLGMFFRGIFTALSQPLFGIIKDVTGSYDAIFPIIGCIQIVGGAVLLLEPIAKRRNTQQSTGNILV